MAPPQHVGRIQVARFDPTVLTFGEEAEAKLAAAWDQKMKDWEVACEKAEKENKDLPAMPVNSNLAGYVKHAVAPHLASFNKHALPYGAHGSPLLSISLDLALVPFHAVSSLFKVTGGEQTAWGFGVHNVAIVNTPDGKQYLLFGNRNPLIAHHSGVEGELVPKGYVYEKDVQPIVSGVDGRTALENLVRQQCAAQTTIPEELIRGAQVEPLGVSMIGNPHWEASAAYALQIQWPSSDLSSIKPKGTKYKSLVPVEREGLLEFVKDPTNRLMPYARSTVRLYAARHPEWVGSPK